MNQEHASDLSALATSPHGLSAAFNNLASLTAASASAGGIDEVMRSAAARLGSPMATAAASLQGRGLRLPECPAGKLGRALRDAIDRQPRVTLDTSGVTAAGEAVSASLRKMARAVDSLTGSMEAIRRHCMPPAPGRTEAPE